MAALVCMARQCSYNNAQKCCKGDIMVGGKNACKSDETCCESFRGAEKDHFSNAMSHPCDTICIDCEAEKCVHNSNYKCHAQNVSIEGSQACQCKETACGTFKEK